MFSSTPLGPPSAPTSIAVGGEGLTGLQANITIPNQGSICVDQYRAYASGIEIENSVPLQTLTVVDSSVTMYSFRFPVDLCRNQLSSVISVNAHAITNGVSGPNITGRGPIDNLDRTSKLLDIVMAMITIETTDTFM